jgi:hypothetical protein
LRETQHPVIGMDGFQNASVALCEPHGGRVGHASVPR